MLRSKLAVWTKRTFFTLSTRHVCQGVDVRWWLPDDDEGPLIEKVCKALGLIALHAPERLADLQQDLIGIWITHAAGNISEYHPDVGLCVLDRTYLAHGNTSTAHIATTLVHEAAHARLHSQGSRYGLGQRAEEESLCYRAEIDFALRLPDGQPLVEEARRQLARDPSTWTDEAAHARAAAKLDQIGVPRWLRRRSMRQQ